MKTIYLLMAALLISTAALAQEEFELPDNIELVAKEDYAKYETTLVKAAKWLEETDLDKEKPMRRDVNAFVVKWVTGSPTVNLDITSALMDLIKKNEDLLGIYFASYSSYCIQNKSDTSYKRPAARAGLISMINVYKKGKSIEKNKDMLKLIKRHEAGELDAYIDEKFFHL